MYILLGKTHPHVLAHEGEAYRESLWARVEELGLADNVRFDDKYADEELLSDYLLAADTYVLPYPNEAQITSGTLSYAVGAGCAVLSTPFWHAKEILTEGRGLLYGFGDSRQTLGKELVALRQNPELQQRLRNAAKSYGQLTTWTMQGTDVPRGAGPGDRASYRQTRSPSCAAYSNSRRSTCSTSAA